MPSALNSVPVRCPHPLDRARARDRARPRRLLRRRDAQSPWSDAEYDAMYRELEALEAAHPALILPDSPTRTVGGRVATDFAEVQHHEHLYSLQDVFSLDEVEKWVERIVATTELSDSELPMTAEVKIDGLAVALTYEHGVLTRAATRGAGPRRSRWRRVRHHPCR